MIDIDMYTNMTKEVRLFGEVLHVKQPTLRMVQKIEAIEKDMTEENVMERRLEVAHMIANNNAEGKKISKDALLDLSRTSLELLIMAGVDAVKEAQMDPNLKSPSQTDQ